jgi:simple sugar transport system permease protein
MQRSSFRLTMTNERLVVLMLVALCLVTGIANPTFFSMATVFDTLRNLTVVGILGMAVLVVMLTGGIDVSFPAIAALTSYATIRIFIGLGFDGPVIAIYALAIVFGVALGLFNGLLVALLRLPALIVTLGTSSLFYGFNLFFLGSQNLFNLPKSLIPFSRSSLMQVTDAYGRTWSLHPVVLLFAVVVLLVAFLLRRTIFGRSLHAIGGSRESAERIGLPVRNVEIFAFVIAGALAAVAGTTQVVFFRNANPGAFSGMELDIIAAVVLGGVSISGGRGSVTGAVAGLTFVVLLTSSLVLMGIPAAWQKVFIGSALILGISLSGWRTVRAERQMPIPPSRMKD